MLLGEHKGFGNHGSKLTGLCCFHSMLVVVLLLIGHVKMKCGYMNAGASRLKKDCHPTSQVGNQRGPQTKFVS